MTFGPDHKPVMLSAQRPLDGDATTASRSASSSSTGFTDYRSRLHLT
ncbi:hypothetical protein ACFPRL_09935 [Pseudoclavibacter helvolus]